MSGTNEEIARLTGTLEFKVETTPLQQFEAMLRRVQSQMAALAKQADQLSSRLQQKLNIKPSAERTKTDNSVRQSLDREAKLEYQVQRARRATMQADLAGQKLTLAQTKQTAYTASQALADKQREAVLAAKQFKAEQERAKLSGVQAKNDITLAAAKTRQQRLEEILRQTQAKTVLLQGKQLQQMSALERSQVSLNQLRQRGQQSAARFASVQAAATERSQRLTEKHEQQRQRFEGWQARQQVWQANQDRPKAPESGMGIVGLGATLGGVAASIYLATKAFDKLAERVQARQSAASEAEQFTTALQTAGGKNRANQDYARQRYLEISDKYGMGVDLDGAKEFAKFVQSQLSLGKSLSQATQVFEDQSATFRAAALNGESQKRAAYQLSQIRAKGKPEGSDVNDLFDAIGGPVASSIRAAAAQRLGFKGKVEEQAGWFKGAVTAGKILARDFDTGMQNYLKANQDVLAKQMQSIDAAQTRADNQAYIANSLTNSSPELKDAVQSNIEAHRELTAAMQPLRDTMLLLDIGLTKFSTYMLRFASGKNMDGTDKTPQEQMQDRMSTADMPVSTSMVGTPDFSKFNGSTQHQGGPIGELWNKLFGVPDYREGEANKLQQPPYHFSADLLLPKLDTSRFNPPPVENVLGVLQRFRPDAFLDAASAMRQVQTPAPTYPTPEQSIVTNSNNTTTVAPANIHVTINAASGADTPEFANTVRENVRQALRDSFNEIIVPQDTE
jgi:hypothetical protein